MGQMQAIGKCINCHRQFSFNPDYVTSVRVNGVKEPVCHSCIISANTDRKSKGIPLIPEHPQAYAPAECM